MARQSHYITTYNHKDIDAYKFLRNVANCKDYQLRTFLTENRIKSWEKERLIEKITTKDGTFYKLTDRAHKTFESKVELQNRIYSSSALLHNCQLAQHYIELYVRYQDNFVYKNENDLKEERRNLIQVYSNNRDNDRLDKMQRASVPDSYVQVGQEEYYYEVITDNYSNQDLQMKISYSQITNIPIQLPKI